MQLKCFFLFSSAFSSNCTLNDFIFFNGMCCKRKLSCTGRFQEKHVAHTCFRLSRRVTSNTMKRMVLKLYVFKPSTHYPTLNSLYQGGLNELCLCTYYSYVSYAYYATLSHIGIKCSDSSSLAPFPQPALIEIMQEA